MTPQTPKHIPKNKSKTYIVSTHLEHPTSETLQDKQQVKLQMTQTEAPDEQRTDTAESSTNKTIKQKGQQVIAIRKKKWGKLLGLSKKIGQVRSRP